MFLAHSLARGRFVAQLLKAVRQTGRSLGFDVDPKDNRYLRVALIWGDDIIYERVFSDPEPVTIGESDRAMFQLSARGLGLATLLRPTAHGWVLRVPEGLQGQITVGGADLPLHAPETLPDELLFEPGDCGRVTFANDVHLTFSFTAVKRRIFPLVWTAESQRFFVSFATTAALVLTFLTAAFLSYKPASHDPFAEDLGEKRDAKIEMMEVAIAEEEVVEPEPIKEVIDKPDDAPPPPPMPKEEGELRDPTSVHEETSLPTNDVELIEDVKVEEIGINAVMRNALKEGGALAGVLDESSAVELAQKLSVPMDGPGGEIQIAQGPKNGLGYKGKGPGGGGCDGCPGGLRTTGKINGILGGRGIRGLRKRVAAGTGRHGPPKRVPPIVLGSPKTTGFCEKGSLARSVRRRASALRACYEMELLAKPGLRGKITAQWTINLEGRVVMPKIVKSSLDSTKVKDCVVRTIARIRFKKPVGGMCIVRWPFAFTSS